MAAQRLECREVNESFFELSLRCYETNARRTWHTALGPTDIPHTRRPRARGRRRLLKVRRRLCLFGYLCRTCVLCERVDFVEFFPTFSFPRAPDNTMVGNKGGLPSLPWRASCGQGDLPMHRSGRTCRESPQSREVLKREVLTSRCSGEDLGSERERFLAIPNNSNTHT